MTDSELFAFKEIFDDVRAVFPLRGDDEEITRIMGQYFRALRRFHLHQVRTGAENCVRAMRKFPRPAEWIDGIPKYAASREITELTPAQAREWIQAELKRWEGEPCSCSLCQEAGVTHRFTRFVPEFDADDRDLRARIGERIITRGHWAHGDELKRYYAARDEFWEKCEVLGLRNKKQIDRDKKRPIIEVLEEIFSRGRKRPDVEPEA